MPVRDAAFADGYERQWEDDDYAYDRARRAVDRGEILPMAKLLERLKTQVRGEVVGVEFEREYGRWVYEFKIIDTKGRLLEVYIDARTGTVISLEDN
ncbi:MAG: peptidase [bacterium]|nr:peptidase [bacterium]